MDLLGKSANFLSGKGLGNARREAEWIFADTLDLSRLELYTRFDMPLDEPTVERLRDRIMRRGRREPLAYVLGSQPFHGLDLAVGSGVLVPRPETEQLVDLVLADLPGGAESLVDVGTGSGAIALACKRARNDLLVTGIDRSEEALAYARRNAASAELSVTWRLGDLLAGVAGRFAMIVANLPYVADGERSLCDPETAFEPPEALFAEDEGLALILRLLEEASERLTDDGRVWLEHGFRQGPRLRDLAGQLGYLATTTTDLAGHERFTRCLRR